jgi:hypothetical protein
MMKCEWMGKSDERVFSPVQIERLCLALVVAKKRDMDFHMGS